MTKSIVLKFYRSRNPEGFLSDKTVKEDTQSVLEAWKSGGSGRSYVVVFEPARQPRLRYEFMVAELATTHGDLSDGKPSLAGLLQQYGLDSDQVKGDMPRSYG